MSDDNKTVLRRIYEAMGAGDVDALDDLVAPDVTVHGTPAAGLRELKQSCATFIAAFPDLRMSIETIVAEGDSVGASVTARGTHTGPLEGIPATGRRMAVRQTDFARVVDGRIVEIWSLYDQFGLLQQLGVVPEPQSA